MSRVLTILFLAACLTSLAFTIGGGGPPGSTETVRAENNRAALKECRDAKNVCVGGFVRWIGSQIVLISDCTNDCRSSEVGYTRLMELAADEDFGYFGDVTLPGVHPQWDIVKAQYIEQSAR